MTKVGIIAAAAACLAAAMTAAPMAASAAMDEIDCGASSFVFADQGFHADCQRSTDQVRAGGSTGASEVDVMTVSAEMIATSSQRSSPSASWRLDC